MSEPIVPYDGPEKTRYLERMQVKFDLGMKSINFFMNYEGLAEKYGGTALYTPYGDLPPVMANGVVFPDQETHDRAWAAFYAELNAVEDEMEQGNMVTMEFGDSRYPNHPYVTEAAKIEHVLKFRKSFLDNGGVLSIHEEDLVSRGIIGKFNPPVRITDVDNYEPPV